jgi:hypothetical protein
MKKYSRIIIISFQFFIIVLLFFGLSKPVYAEITAEEITCNKNGGACQWADCDPKTQTPMGECKYQHCCAPKTSAVLSTPNLDWDSPKLQIKIPGMPDFTKPTQCGTDAKTNMPIYCVKWIGEYVAGIYKYGIGIVGILAAVVLMFGGLLWLTAGGNATQVGEAKAWIGASMTGLVIALTSYMILYQINPDLLNLKALEVTMIKEEKLAPTGTGGGQCVWKKPVNYNDLCGSTSYTYQSDISKCPEQTQDNKNNNEVSCCCPKTSSLCQAQNSGDCSANNPEIINAFGAQNAQKAAAIANYESAGCNAGIESGSDKCCDGNSFSIGLFQINIRANKVNGVDCPSAFAGSGKKIGNCYDCSVINTNTYEKCKTLTKDKSINIRTAGQLSGNGKNWSPWLNTVNKCGL